MPFKKIIWESDVGMTTERVIDRFTSVVPRNEFTACEVQNTDFLKKSGSFEVWITKEQNLLWQIAHKDVDKLKLVFKDGELLKVKEVKD